MSGDRLSRTHSCEKMNGEETENLQELSVCYSRLTQSEGERAKGGEHHEVYRRYGKSVGSSEGKFLMWAALTPRCYRSSCLGPVW